MKTTSHPAMATLALCLFPGIIPSASATTVANLRKDLTAEQQAVYVSGSVAIFAYSYAADGHRTYAVCVKDWYFATDSPSGPPQLAEDLGRAEAVDPDKYHVEGFIIDLADKACGVPPSVTRVKLQNDPQQDLLDDIADLRKVLQGQHDRAVAEKREAERKLQEARDNALVLRDGRRVYFTRDGQRLYGEDRREITDAATIGEARKLLAARPPAASPEPAPQGERKSVAPSSSQPPAPSRQATRSATDVHLQRPAVIPVPPISVKNFRTASPSNQSLYVSGAVAMLSYSYAASDQIDRARCVNRWYFGAADTPEPAGPRAIAVEVGVAERADAEKYRVEGIVLGVTEKACPATVAQPASK